MVMRMVPGRGEAEQSTVTIDGDHATGESYMIMIALLRFLDTFAKIDGSYFAERDLLLDWSETRPSSPGT
jgi:hypothetical protein